LISLEFKTIQDKVPQLSTNVKIRLLQGLRQIVFQYAKDDYHLEFNISLPANYPLIPLTIQPAKQTSNNQKYNTAWILQMTTLLYNSEGNIWDILMLLKINMDKYFEGVEPCPICYSTVNQVDGAIPKMACKQCKNKFHGPCLYKWFSTSGNNSCPLCRAQGSF